MVEPKLAADCSNERRLGSFIAAFLNYLKAIKAAPKRANDLHLYLSSPSISRFFPFTYRWCNREKLADVRTHACLCLPLWSLWTKDSWVSRSNVIIPNVNYWNCQMYSQIYSRTEAVKAADMFHCLKLCQRI